MARTITVDLNARSKNGWIRVRTRLLGREAQTGDLISITDIDRTTTGEAELAEIDSRKELAYLNVDWTSFEQLQEVVTSRVEESAEPAAHFSGIRLHRSDGVAFGQPSDLVLSGGHHSSELGSEHTVHG